MELATNPEYMITFSKGRGKSGEVPATLWSPLLDTDLHPNKRAKISIEPTSDPLECAGRSIDSFHINSIIDYIGAQTSVAHVLQTELSRVRTLRLPGVLPLSANELWATSQVECVTFESRNIQTMESLAPLRRRVTNGKTHGLKPERIAAIIAKSDTPNTQSRFTLLVKTAIDDEVYHYLAIFRDRELLEFAAH